MRKYWALALLPLIALIGCNWNTNKPRDVDLDSGPVKTAPVEVDFKLTPEQAAADLVDKGVSVGPFSQLWVFAENQNVTVKILQKKVVDDTVVVIAQLDAVAITTNQPEPKEQPKSSSPPPAESGTSVPPGPGKAPATTPAPKQPETPAPPPAKEQRTAIRLTGVAKLVYEEVAGKWYLVGVGSVNLQLKVIPGS